MVLITKDIFINASPEVVRNTFLDFESHSKWNPFFVSFKAPNGAEVGKTLDIDMKLKGDSKSTNIKPTVQVNNEEEFKWKGKLGFDSLFVGEHYFLFKPVDGGTSTHLMQGENFGGVLVSVFSMIGIFEKAKASFEDLNQALKKEAESRAA